MLGKIFRATILPMADGAMADLWKTVLLVLLLFIIWLASGGPTKREATSGLFLSAPVIPQLAQLRVPTSAPTGAVTKSSRDLIGDQTTLLRSPYYGQVRIGTGNARSEYQPNREYLTLTAGYGLAGPINITGWYLKNGRDERFYATNNDPFYHSSRGVSKVVIIPAAAEVFVDGAPNWQNTPVELSRGGRVVIISGQMFGGRPYLIDPSFRVNKCSGYLDKGDTVRFTPALSTNCPDPEAETDHSILDDECYNFVRRLPRCHVTEVKRLNGDIYIDGRLSSLSYQCRDYLASHFNYNFCVARHRHDPDFLTPDWRLFLGQPWELWDDQREVITLLDQEGRLVDQVKY